MFGCPNSSHDWGRIMSVNKTTNCPKCSSEDTVATDQDGACLCNTCGYTWVIPPQKVGGSQFIEPPSTYKGIAKTMDWKGVYVKTGSGYGPFFFNEIEKIRNNIEACIIAVTGPGGSGKTYFALRLAQLLDPTFNPKIQVPFGSSAFLTLISEDSPLKMGQFIIPDESQFTMGARNWYEDIQKDLMNQIEAVRSKGYVIMIIALNMAVLDKIARSYVMTHLIHMNKRGEATAYRFYMPAFAKEPYKKKLGKVRLMLPGAEECGHSSCLRCGFSGVKKSTWAKRGEWAADTPICQNIRAQYEREKKAYLERTATEAGERRQKTVKPEFPKKKLMEVLLAHLDELKVTRNEKVDRARVRLVLQKYEPNTPVNDSRHRRLAEDLELEYPLEFAKIRR